MKKIEMARIIVNSIAWNGTKNAEKLAKNNTKEELKDMYDMLEMAEEEYMN